MYDGELQEQANITLQFNNVIQNDMKLIRWSSAISAFGTITNILSNVIGICIFCAVVTYIISGSCGYVHVLRLRSS